MPSSQKPIRKQKRDFILAKISILAFAGMLFLFGIAVVVANAEEQTSQSNKESDNVSLQKSKEEPVSEIQEQLESKKKKINELKSQISKYEQSIRARQREALSLANQISILNDNIEKTRLDIELTQNQVEKTNIEIRTTELQIEDTQNEIEAKKELIANYLNLLFRLERKKIVEVFLENDSLSDFFIQRGVAERVQHKIKENKIKLDSEKKLLDMRNASLQDKKLSLLKFSQELDTKRSTLEQNKYVRAKILIDTKNSEQKFRMALQDLKAEQNAINADIVELEKEIRKKVQSGGMERLKQLGSVVLSWPVENQGITSFFHDPDYPFRYIFEHPAIDIRAPQGTPIRAPAPGFVGRVRDGGKYGYSYLMIVHNDGISTVYGHVSGFNVVEDQFVNQGDIIAFSGGRPGTRGAGRLTTGPHLHFEVRVNGIPVDPLEYLP